jgi:hypothetical protein
MSRKFLTPIDLTGLEILNVRFQNLATNPTPKGKGHVYYNTTDDTVYVYDGTSWQASGKIVAGTLASRPAAGSSGRLYFATDATEQVLYYDNGTAWTKIGESKTYIDQEIADAISDHNVASGIHGVTGSVVGTTDTQTLSNKTISDNLHFNDGSAAGFIAADTGDLTIDGSNTINVTADDNINLTTNNGNIVLNPDGGAYIGNSASEDNRIATLGDLGTEGVNSIVAGANINVSGDGTGDVTVSLSSVLNVPSDVSIGSDSIAEENNDAVLRLYGADGTVTFESSSVSDESFFKGRVGFNNSADVEKAHFEHSGTGTFRIIADEDLALRAQNGDVILYPGTEGGGGTGRAYVGWGNDATDAGLGNEILTRDANQVITNKTVNDELYFTNPSTAGEDGGIYVDDTSEEFVVKAYNSNLIATATGANADVILDAPNGDIYKTTNSSDDNILVTRGDEVTLTNKTLGSGTLLGADLDADEYTITNLADPENDMDAANKRYVDAATAGLSWKQAVNLLYDAAIPVMSGSGATQLVIDGHTVLGDANSGYRILITQSTNAGIWDYNSTDGTWELTRSADADTFEELKGAAVFVMEGDVYGSTSWVQSSHYITNFTGQTWAQFSGQGTYTAGDGLELNGSEFTVKLDSDSLAKSANGLKVNLNETSGLGIDEGLFINAGTGLSINGSNQLTINTDVVARKYSESVGNGTLTSFVLTHNLNTRDVTVTVYDTASYAEVFADVSHSTVNTVTVAFAEAPTTDQYRVVIVG